MSFMTDCSVVCIPTGRKLSVFRELNETYQFIYVSILLFFKPFLSKSIVYRRMSNCLG